MFKGLFKKLEKLTSELSQFAGESENEQIIKQNCPSCGGNMEGKISQPTLSCPYCGTSATNEHYKSYAQQQYSQTSTSQNVDMFFPNQHHRRHHDYNGVFAYIEKSGLFYSGEIPGISFSKVSLCDSYDECLNKLTAILTENKNKAFYKPPVQDLNEIRKNHPKAKIIRL